MQNYYKKDILNVLKLHEYANLESDKPSSSYGQNLPYRDFNGKIIKGIGLFRTSPVTFTDAGRNSGIRKVDNLLNDFSKIGIVKRLSEFGFVCKVLASSKKCFLIEGCLNYKEGIVYDQTYHYLDITITLTNINQATLDEFQNYKDSSSEKYELTKEYLNYICSTIND